MFRINNKPINANTTKDIFLVVYQTRKHTIMIIKNAGINVKKLVSKSTKPPMTYENPLNSPSKCAYKLVTNASTHSPKGIRGILFTVIHLFLNISCKGLNDTFS